MGFLFTAPSAWANPHGAFETSIPLKVPAYHGLEPKLALVYSSTRRSGWVGSGWSLSGISYIQRASPGKGTPLYDQSDIFLLDGIELIPCAKMPTIASTPSCSTGGTHTTKIETFRRIRYDSATDEWSLWYKNGTKARYTALSRVDTLPSCPTCVPPLKGKQETFEWAIAGVTDTHRNEVQYNYQDAVLISTSYGGVPIVILTSQTLPASLIQTYARGVDLAQISKRLKGIEIRGFTGSTDAPRTALLHYYDLSYAVDQLSGQFFLSQIQEYGRDLLIDSTGNLKNAATATKLPPVTFTYSGGTARFNYSRSESHIAVTFSGSQADYLTDAYWQSHPEYYETISFPDLDGDGKADLCYRYADGIRCAVNTGTGSFGTVVQGPPWSDAAGWNASKYYSTIRYPDINGDGKADVCARDSSGIVCYLGTGAGFNLNSPIRFPTNVPRLLEELPWSDANGWGKTEYYSTIQYPDLNADGKADICGANATAIICFVSTGVAFQFFSSLPSAAPTDTNRSAQYYSNIRFPDINGDGRADICIAYAYVHCWRSSESGLIPIVIEGLFGSSSNLAEVPFAGRDVIVTADYPDLNGDGKADICFADAGNAGAISCKLATARGFVDATGFYFALGNSGGAGCTHPGLVAPLMFGPCRAAFPDLNGDGKADLCFVSVAAFAGVRCSLGTGNAWSELFDVPILAQTWFQSYYSTIHFPDLNGDGKADIIGRSKDGLEYRLTDLDGVRLLASVAGSLGARTTVEYVPSSKWVNFYLPVGLIFQTVSRITVDDGRGNSTSQNISYYGGMWSDRERQFLGFQKITSILDKAGNYQETYYYQDDQCMTSPMSVFVRNPARRLYGSVTFYYMARKAAPWRCLLQAIETDRCDLYSGECQKVMTQFDYDLYGNLTSTYDWGDLSLSGDEREVRAKYYYNTDAYAVGLIRAKELYDPGKLVSQTLYEYDNGEKPLLGEPLVVKQWHDKTNSYYATAYSYTPTGQVATITDAKGSVSTISYSSDDLYPTKLCNALQQCTVFQWDYTLGRITSITDPNAAVYKFSYDPLGRPSGATDPYGARRTTSYANWGHPNAQYIIETINDGSPSGLWTAAMLDGLGRVYRLGKPGRDAQGPQIYAKDFIYADASSPMKKESHWYTWERETPVFEEYSWDPFGRLLSIGHPDSTIATVEYGAGSVHLIDESAHDKYTFFDAYGRINKVGEKNSGYCAHPVSQEGAALMDTCSSCVTQVCRAAPECCISSWNGACVARATSPEAGFCPKFWEYSTTNYTYDAQGNLRVVRDDTGNVVRMEYDSLGRKVSLSDPDKGTWSYGYDELGNLIRQTDARGKTIIFGYDPLSRLKTKVYPFKMNEVPRTVEWWYDEPDHGAGIGRLTSARGYLGLDKFSYDLRGNRTSETRCISFDCYTTGLGYDAIGRLSSIIYPDNETVAYKYDEGGRLVSVAGAVLGPAGARSRQSYVQNIMYNAQGQVMSVSYGNRTEEQFDYDRNRFWVKAASITAPTITFENGRIKVGRSRVYSAGYDYDPVGNIKQITYAPQTGTVGVIARGFTYDELSRIGTATNLFDMFTTGYRYGYDNLGNLMFNSAAGRYVYGDAADPKVRPHAVSLIEDSTGAKMSEFHYDDNGNMISSNDRTIEWNDDNLIQSVTDKTGPVATFYYDAFGTRVQKSDSKSATSYFSPLLECRFENSNPGAGCKLVKYYFAGAVRVARRDSQGLAWYHTDHLGTVRLMTDASGVTVRRYDYTPFGEVVPGSSAFDDRNDFGFAGQRLDKETGLMYLNARFYDPKLGRFVSGDDVTARPFDPQSLNRYSYAENNPVLFSDPTGYDISICTTPAGGACTGTGGGGGGAGGGGNNGSLASGDILEQIHQLLLHGFGGGGGGSRAGDPVTSPGGNPVASNPHAQVCNDCPRLRGVDPEQEYWDKQNQWMYDLRTYGFPGILDQPEYRSALAGNALQLIFAFAVLAGRGGPVPVRGIELDPAEGWGGLATLDLNPGTQKVLIDQAIAEDTPIVLYRAFGGEKAVALGRSWTTTDPAVYGRSGYADAAGVDVPKFSDLSTIIRAEFRGLRPGDFLFRTSIPTTAHPTPYLSEIRFPDEGVPANKMNRVLPGDIYLMPWP